jgi:hypothetical protein
MEYDDDDDSEKHTISVFISALKMETISFRNWYVPASSHGFRNQENNIGKDDITELQY